MLRVLWWSSWIVLQTVTQVRQIATRWSLFMHCLSSGLDPVWYDIKKVIYFASAILKMWQKSVRPQSAAYSLSVLVECALSWADIRRVGISDWLIKRDSHHMISVSGSCDLCHQLTFIATSCDLLVDFSSASHLYYFVIDENILCLRQWHQQVFDVYLFNTHIISVYQPCQQSKVALTLLNE